MFLPVSNGVGLSTVSLAESTFTLPTNPRDYRPDDIVKLLEELDMLAQQSDPVHGPETTAGKDTRAYFALQRAGALIYNLAGWALQHRYGLALNQGLSLRPEHADNPDSHNHEMRGVTAIAQRLPLEASMARGALRNILEPLLEGMLFLSPIRQELGEALAALNFGETLPMFKPFKKGQKRRYFEVRGQLRAIGHIEFRRSSSTKEKAQREVAEVYGIGFETVKSWEHRLKKKLGKKAVAREIAIARAAAEQSTAETGQNSDWTVLARLGYSDEALRRDAERYKEHLRQQN